MTGDFFLNMCPSCFKGGTQQPFESSLQEENSPDVTGDDFVEELLFYFRGFAYFDNTEDDIKQKCCIEQGKKVWSLDEIKQAWKEAKSLGKKRKKYWSRVILLQELKRRVCNDKGKRRIPEIFLEQDDDCVKRSRKRHTSDRSLESNTELNMGGDDASQVSEDLQKTLSFEERLGEPQSLGHILIPLSVISENESTSTKYVAVSTPNNSYTLKDGVPRRKENNSVSEITKRKSYVMSFNDKTNNADWTYEILNESTLAKKSIELNFKSTNNRTNYEKGHLAAAANHRWCLEAKNDASLFSNMTPQHKILNKGTWSALEEHCRKTVKDRTGCNVHVYTGPLYLEPELKWMGGKALPSHFFKVMIVEDNNGEVTELECFKMPNLKKQFGKFDNELYKVSIIEIQKDSGLTFIETSSTTKIRNSIKMITWKGKDAFGNLQQAFIKVRISSDGDNHNDADNKMITSMALTVSV